MEKLVDTIDAASEDGRQFRILVYRKLIDARSMSNPNAPPMEGLKRATTSDGHECNRIDDDTFLIVNLGLTVKRIND